MKIAIIGTSTGQQELYRAAREMGLYIIGFSWDQGCIPDDNIDKFYPISIVEKEEIVKICMEEDVDGVVTNGSELTIQIASYVAERLNKICTPCKTILDIQDKAKVRSLTNEIHELSKVKTYLYSKGHSEFLPCIVKPVTGGGKTGVSFASTEEAFQQSISYCQNNSCEDILIEQYVEGNEVSVESISYKGHHYIIQITDKDTSGPPHFVELGHHQPSSLPKTTLDNIRAIIPQILDAVGFTNGATHIELKIAHNGSIYLIEVNPRGGGDEISSNLVRLSTGYDYIKGMIEVALGIFKQPQCHSDMFSGIYFLTKQTQHLVSHFKNADAMPWYISGKINSYDLKECMGNAYKNGYLIYQSNKKIILK